MKQEEYPNNIVVYQTGDNKKHNFERGSICVEDGAGIISVEALEDNIKSYSTDLYKRIYLNDKLGNRHSYKLTTFVATYIKE